MNTQQRGKAARLARGCCCHDAPGDLSDSERVIVERLTAAVAT